MLNCSPPCEFELVHPEQPATIGMLRHRRLATAQWLWNFATSPLYSRLQVRRALAKAIHTTAATSLQERLLENTLPFLSCTSTTSLSAFPLSTSAVDGSLSNMICRRRLTHFPQGCQTSENLTRVLLLKAQLLLPSCTPKTPAQHCLARVWRAAAYI